MNPAELRERRAFEWRLLDEMGGDVFYAEAYAKVSDLDAKRSPILREADASDAICYRLGFNIPTFVGAGKFTDFTEIGVDSSVADYPLTAPRTWILSEHVPWNPHFMRGSPVCIGPHFWAPKHGHVTVAELAIHIAHLLNWDEKGRGPGYQGWNGEAIAYHKAHYGNLPLDAGIEYPRLPLWFTGDEPDDGLFLEIVASDSGPLGFDIDQAFTFELN